MPGDLDLIASFADAERAAEPVRPDPWADSPFAWMPALAPRSKGRIGEAIVARWARSCGLGVERASGASHDLRIESLPVEVKLSLLWRDGKFCFSQLRPHGYEVAALLGLLPGGVRLWIAPRELCREKARGQHTGQDARETRWLSFPAAEPPPWLAPYGGTLACARRALLAALGH